MSNAKLALTRADVLLIAATVAVGSVICALSAEVVDYLTAPNAPKEIALKDSFQIPRLEQELSTARERRASGLARLRELEMQRIADNAGLQMARSDLAALPGKVRGARQRTQDSLVKSIATLTRAVAGNAIMASGYEAMTRVADSAVAVRARAFAIASDSVDSRMRAAKIKHALARAGLNAVGVIVAIGFILGGVAIAIRLGNRRVGGVQPKLVVTTALILIALVFLQQQGGTLLTIGVATGITALLVLWKLAHVPR